ncbi:MAG: VWA domain-containing protein [Planctomycetales bacterium]|nr:VWA domain-containing protein [Planctomycetales bacterium]
MKVAEGLRTWWQAQTGEEDTPFDGDSTSFVASVVFHVFLLLALGLTPLVYHTNQVVLTIETPLVEEEPEILELPEEFVYSELPAEEIGAHSVNGSEAAMSQAPIVADISTEVPSPAEEVFETEVPVIEINNFVEQAVGREFSNLPVKGPAGVGETGASGAVDRITHEILLSLQERKTLVVWLFDQSGSLTRQRSEILDRFERIYKELGVIEAAGAEEFKKHESDALLTSVIAFGDKVNLLTKKPTNNLTEIKEAVGSIKRDDSGVERVFSAIYMAADQYRMLRAPDADTGQPARNVMLIAFTDEVGDDQDGLESTIRKCRQYEMPVYVVGVPAPFGRAETLVKWVDPDPSFDQTPQWGQVNQGPESFMPERIKLNFSGARNKDADPIDSGFGPFSLTRLCVETGGIYFAVHPNRNVNREVSRNETAEFSAHLKHFFDPNIMRKYRPDYVSQDEYVRRVSSNKARTSLLQAAKMSWISPMEEPQTRFVKRSEAEFANELSEAQKAAAKLEPRMQALYDVLKLGEADREKEVSPRWQAGYDLALGRVLAVKVRTEAYNAMLAAAKRGLKQDDPKSNTWILEPANEISVGSRMEKDAENARALLERVVNDHPSTPWALLAKQELENPVGWKWKEDFTDFSPPGNGGGGNGNAPAPANDAKRMMAKPAPKRAPPKL